MKLENSPGQSDARKIDKRVVRSREIVLKVTSDLLFERGMAGASVDEVSRRSGVAKTTIYRHWPTRADLLRDASRTISTPQDVPDTGKLKTDLVALLTDLAAVLTTARWPRVLPSIIDAGERDPTIADMYASRQIWHSGPYETVIRRAVERGELPEDTNASVLTASLVGPLFYRRWFSREPLTDAFVKATISLFIE